MNRLVNPKPWLEGWYLVGSFTENSVGENISEVAQNRSLEFVKSSTWPNGWNPQLQQSDESELQSGSRTHTEREANLTHTGIETSGRLTRVSRQVDTTRATRFRPQRLTNRTNKDWTTSWRATGRRVSFSAGLYYSSSSSSFKYWLQSTSSCLITVTDVTYEIFSSLINKIKRVLKTRSSLV